MSAEFVHDVGIRVEHGTDKAFTRDWVGECKSEEIGEGYKTQYRNGIDAVST